MLNKIPKKKSIKSRESKTVFKESTGMTSESDSDFENSSESENEWHVKQKTSKRPQSSSDAETDEIGDEEICELTEIMPPRKRRCYKSRPPKAMEPESENDGPPELTHETPWTEAELSLLTDVLDEMRRKGEYLGIYGVNERQASIIHKKLYTKSERQIKTVVLTALQEYRDNDVSTSAIELWDDLFEAIIPDDVGKQQCEDYASIFKDKAAEIDFLRRRNNSGGVDFGQIYRYLSECSKPSSRTNDLPPLSLDSSKCLGEILSELSEETDGVLNKELEGELNSRYCAILMNRKSMKSLDGHRKIFTENNPEFDQFNPLALNLERWKKYMNADDEVQPISSTSIDKCLPSTSS